MIQMLKTYYTSGGRKVVPIAFDSGLYSCNDGKGKRLLLKPDQLFETNPRKKVKLEKPMGEVPEVVPEFIFEDEQPEVPKELPKIEASSSEEKKPVDKIPEIQDNIKETADDFYADL